MCVKPFEVLVSVCFNSSSYFCSMRKESFAAEMMNYTVSGYVYFVAFMLVLYMVSSLVAGVLGVGASMLDISTSARGILSSPERTALELQLLHTITFTFVLVKAYNILISFAQTRRINIKFLIEIAIIAPTIEIIFNLKNHSLEINIVLALFAFANLVAYLFFYKTSKTVSADYEKHCKE
jgi:uncharacterized membrane protein (DUF373 family)